MTGYCERRNNQGCTNLGRLYCVRWRQIFPQQLLHFFHSTPLQKGVSFYMHRAERTRWQCGSTGHSTTVSPRHVTCFASSGFSSLSFEEGLLYGRSAVIYGFRIFNCAVNTTGMNHLKIIWRFISALHTFSKNLGVTSKFEVPEGWQVLGAVLQNLVARVCMHLWVIITRLFRLWFVLRLMHHSQGMVLSEGQCLLEKSKTCLLSALI